MVRQANAQSRSLTKKEEEMGGGKGVRGRENIHQRHMSRATKGGFNAKLAV